jgi:hypothetical protein
MSDEGQEGEWAGRLKCTAPIPLAESNFCHTMKVQMNSLEELPKSEPTNAELLEDFQRLMREDPLENTKFRHALDGTVIYGPPVSKKTKKAIAWVKHVMEEEKVEFKRELFAVFCPLHWMYVWSEAKGWWKIYVGDFYG